MDGAQLFSYLLSSSRLRGGRGSVTKLIFSSSERVLSFSKTQTVVTVTVNSLAEGRFSSRKEFTGMLGLCFTASSRRDLLS